MTDKMPSNFLYLGLIQKLYPNAKIIHSKRNMLDTCVSCFRHILNASYSYTTRLDWLGAFYREYERMMAHWKSVLTLPIHEMNYESLVTNPREEIPRLVSFVDSTWSPNAWCLTRTSVSSTPLPGLKLPADLHGLGRVCGSVSGFLSPLVQTASKPCTFLAQRRLGCGLVSHFTDERRARDFEECHPLGDQAGDECSDAAQWSAQVIGDWPLVESISALVEQGKEVILVKSGSVGIGARLLDL